MMGGKYRAKIRRTAKKVTGFALKKKKVSQTCYILFI